VLLEIFTKENRKEKEKEKGKRIKRPWDRIQPVAEDGPRPISLSFPNR
jgi:hypothetical protein